MTQNASVTITGYVAMEPKLVLTKYKQTPVVNLRIGSTYRRLDANTGEWRELGTSFFTVNCWNRLAFSVAASLRKGDPIIVRGRLKTRAWNDKGATRTVHEIEADAIGHDMAYGWSHFMRGVHPKHEGLFSALGRGDVDGVSAAADGLPDAGLPADAGFPADGGSPDGDGASPLAASGSFADDSGFADDRGFADEDDSGSGLPDPESPESPDGSAPSADDGAAAADASQVGDLAAEAVPF
jgi:single-strand DNA-binding protein